MALVFLFPRTDGRDKRFANQVAAVLDDLRQNTEARSASTLQGQTTHRCAMASADDLWLVDFGRAVSRSTSDLSSLAGTRSTRYVSVWIRLCDCGAVDHQSGIQTEPGLATLGNPKIQLLHHGYQKRS